MEVLPSPLSVVIICAMSVHVTSAMSLHASFHVTARALLLHTIEPLTSRTDVHTLCTLTVIAAQALTHVQHVHHRHLFPRPSGFSHSR
jgi:hypothetical protein